MPEITPSLSDDQEEQAVENVLWVALKGGTR
jgi:hypothetical protein